MKFNTPFTWLEFRPRPKKDGLHDSGYRYIDLVGVAKVNGEEVRTQLHQWADVVTFEGGATIDVTEEGTIRIRPWLHRGWTTPDDVFSSSAAFEPVPRNK